MHQSCCSWADSCTLLGRGRIPCDIKPLQARKPGLVLLSRMPTAFQTTTAGLQNGCGVPRPWGGPSRSMSHVAPPAACLTGLLAQARAGEAGLPAAGPGGGALRLRQRAAARGLLPQKVLPPHALQRCSDRCSAKRMSCCHSHCCAAEINESVLSPLRVASTSNVSIVWPDGLWPSWMVGSLKVPMQQTFSASPVAWCAGHIPQMEACCGLTFTCASAWMRCVL